MKISRQSGRWGPFLLTAAMAGAALPHHWATAHEGDRVYSILEITDDMLAQIDLRDGTTDEWPDLLGEPALRTIDFKTDSEYFSTEYDPADFDFAIWLGWHEELNRIYFAGTFVDNAYWGGTGPAFGPDSDRDRITFVVDGDHSGPLAKDITGEGSRRLDIQGYYATPWVSEGPTVIMPWVTHRGLLESLGDWMIHPPYCEAGGNVVGENPAIWSMEFFVTPFDLLVALEPDECVVSDLTAGEVIGFGLGVWDRDSFDRTALYGLGKGPGTDDALLLSRDQAASVVRDFTWGRIKAALGMDRQGRF